MQQSLNASARTLFRWAMGIFLVTIVIGILNGLDIWEPSRELVLTHVHAGTLGWITMSVIAVGLVMFSGGADESATKAGRQTAQLTIVATVLYVVTFATTTGIMRPIAGTLMLIAILRALAWVGGRYKASEKTVTGLAMYLAMISLAIGAVLGVLLGLFIANGEIPGLDVETSGAIAGAHPPAMLVGYLMLAGAAIAEYFLSDRQATLSESKSGRTMAWLLFGAGMFFNIAFILDVEALIQVATLLELVGVIIFVSRMWKHIKPAAWSGGGSRVHGRLSVVWLAIGMLVFVYVVQLFVTGQIDPEAGEGLNLLTAFDHAMFLGVMTNALLLAVGASTAYGGAQRLIVWGMNVGLAGFMVGLFAESAPLKRTFTPILGAALLLAAYGLYTSKAESSTG